MQRAVGEDLASYDRIQCDIEQQTGQHRRHRRRAFGMSIRQPVVQRRQADLGAVADQQKDECQSHHSGLQLPLDGVEVRPQQRTHALAPQVLFGRDVQQGRAE